MLTQPIRPFRGYRTIDAWGGGGFSAPRVKDGVNYAHKGLDFKAEAGDTVVAPIGGTITHIGIAYPNADLASIHLTSSAARVKILYAKPELDIIVGTVVEAGQFIAVAQSVAGYWQAQEPHKGPMTNHVHVELEVLEGETWVLVNPADYLDSP